MDGFGRWIWSVAVVVAIGSGGGAFAVSQTRTAHVRVVDSEGRPQFGLDESDFRVWLAGRPVEVLESRPLNRAQSGDPDPEAALRLVIYLSEDLDFREAFRAQRSVLDLTDRLDLARDSAAVYSRYALSGFTRDRERLRWMIRLFGEEIDRMGYGRAAPPTGDWRESWPPEPPDPAQSEAALERLEARGTQGRLTSALTPFRNLAGWKVLLYFGRDVPYQPEELEYHDPLYGARALSDAGFTVFAFNPSGRGDSGTERMKEWAEATGGSVVARRGDLRPLLRDWLRTLDYAYLLRLPDSGPRDCRWTDLRIELIEAGLEARHPAGFFATLEAPLDLTQRTLWTVVSNAGSFADFPMEMAAEVIRESAPPPGPPPQTAVKVALRFPFAATRDQDTRRRPSRTGKFEQRVQIFVGVYDRGGRLMGRFEAAALLSREYEEMERAPEELARLDETIPLNRFDPPARLRAAVVIGQNRRIATRTFSFAAENPD